MPITAVVIHPVALPAQTIAVFKPSSEALIQLWASDQGQFKQVFEEAQQLGPVQYKELIDLCTRHRGSKNQGMSLLEILIASSSPQETLPYIQEIIRTQSRYWECMSGGYGEFILKSLRWAVDCDNGPLAQHLVTAYPKLNIEQPLISGHSLFSYYVKRGQKKEVDFLLALMRKPEVPIFKLQAEADFPAIEPIAFRPPFKIYALPWEGDLDCIEDEYEQGTVEKKEEQPRIS